MLRRLAAAARRRLAGARAWPSSRRSSCSGAAPPGAAVAGRLGRALSSAADLRPGDYVVHVEHGVGRFLGFDTKTVGGVTRDYVNLQFKGEDRLFVPHDQLAKLSRYIGADGRPPALSKLGGKAWHTLRSRARAAVHELAGELLRLYAVRQTRTRPPYADEEGWLERMERAFAYTETEDQGRAIDEVLEDLTGEQPMDRLICGDVGFGKTEVAMRAAFLVAISGRQVLVLAPTTLLVQQHLQTFRDRFRDFPVRVEAVSRMRDAAEVKQALREFTRGQDRGADRHPPRALARRRSPSSSGSSWSTRSSASACARRSCCASCGSRSTRSRCRRRRSRARCTCRSPGCATSA